MDSKCVVYPLLRFHPPGAYLLTSVWTQNYLSSQRKRKWQCCRCIAVRTWPLLSLQHPAERGFAGSAHVFPGGCKDKVHSRPGVSLVMVSFVSTLLHAPICQTSNASHTHTCHPSASECKLCGRAQAVHRNANISGHQQLFQKQN